MKKLFPLLLAILGTAGGVGAGLFFAPDEQSETVENDSEHEESDHGEEDLEETAHDDADNAHGSESGESDFVRLNNQFIVPVLSDGRVVSLVVLSISLETELEQSETVFHAEPKLRDVFLTVLYDHANSGGFSGSFTDAQRMSTLRVALYEAAETVLGDVVKSVLIQDLNRQDV